MTQTTSQFFKERSRIKTPVILQMEAVECGATALGIILAYYGKYVSSEELRVACGVSRDGSKASNMVKAARTYGLDSHGAEGEIDALHEAKFPFIAYWKFNHFIVVEDIQPDLIYINDPATGRRTVSNEEFNRDYTGVILLMEPTPEFKPSGLKPSIIRSLKDRFFKSFKTIQFLILISLALVIPGIIIPGFSKIFIDDILLKGIHNWLILLFIGMAVTAILRGLFEAFEKYYWLRFDLKLLVVGSAQMLWHVFRLPISFFEQRYVGDIAERLGANERIASILSADISTSVVSIITTIFFGILLFIYDWSLALIGVTTTVLSALSLYWAASRLRDTSQKFLQDRGRLEGISISGLQLIETLKSSVLDNVFFKRWAGNHAKIIVTEQELDLYNLVITTFSGFIGSLSTVFILGLGSYRIMEGYLSVGTLIAFQTLLASFNAPINNLLSIGTKIQQIPGDINRINDVLNQTIDPRYSIVHDDTKTKLSNDYSIHLKDVTFGYSKVEDPLIENFNLTLKTGGQVALVGATGSGKSTVGKLITGLYPIWSGSIEIGGESLKQLSPKQIASMLALVDQDILLFEGTVRDNLTLWNTSIPFENLEHAARDACIYEVLEHRPKFFHTHVEEGGRNFSGGEKQRLEIARALVRYPKILILDEGTASLDSITEERIVKNLKARGSSLLLITHRLSTIRDSDEIIVLDKGTILERGNHDELMAKNGKYAELIASAM